MGWDDSDEEEDWDAKALALPGAAKNDADEEVWSDEEGHDAHKQADPEDVVSPEPKAAGAPKEKSGLAKKIEEREKREAAEAARKEQLRKQLEANSEVIEITDDMDDVTKEKLRRQKREEAEAMNNAIDAFGLDPTAMGAAPPSASGAAAASAGPAAAARIAELEAEVARLRAPKAADRNAKPLPEFEGFQCKINQDFEKLAEIMAKKLEPHEGTKGHLVCLKAFLKLSTKETTSDEVKDLAAAVSVIQNAKLTADRSKDKQKLKINAKKDKFAGAAAKARARDDDDDFF